MKSYDKKINQLIDMYIKAEKRIVKIISTKKVKGQVTDFYESMLKQIKLELMQLQLESSKYSKDIVNELYLEAYNKSLKELNIDSIGEGFAKLHTDAINILSDNLINNFSEVNNQVGRKIEDTIRDIGLTNTQMKFATGQTIKQLQNELKEALISNRIGGITDKRGRVIPFVVYAKLLGRSIVAETQNTSVLNVAKEHNKDLVKMTEHKTACDICVKYEGKIYSISGSDDVYPSLKNIPGFNRGYNNIHPNCRHRISVYVEKYSKEAEIKKELEELGIKGEISIPPKKINTDKLEFDEYHINIERKHNVTKEEAITFIENARVSVSKWDGMFINYFSKDGVSYIDVGKNTIRTSYKKSEFKGDPKIIMEVVNKYEKN